jgi:hypothetical protein
MPISVSCPACGKEYNVKDEAAGRKFKCKECEAVVEVPAGSTMNVGPANDFGDAENPFGNLDIGDPAAVGSPIPRRRSASPQSGGRSAALERLAGPAVGMMVTAGIGILGILGIAALLALGLAVGPPPGQNMGQADMFLGLAVWGVILFVALILMCLVIYGAVKMKRGESYGMAMAASVLASIPCLTLCICMPFGLWGLVVLFDDAVKGTFR